MKVEGEICVAYKELRKFYYQDEKAYAAEYQRRFSSEETIKLDFLVGNHQAFFWENTDVLKLAAKIFKLDKEVTLLAQRLPGIAQEQYSRKCLIDEIVLTNNIEGVRSSRKEIGEALEILEKQTAVRGKRARFVGLVKKYLKLLGQETIPLDRCEDIRAIYDEVFLEEVVSEDPNHAPDGKLFRKEMSTVYNGRGKAIHDGLAPESEIIQAMERALQFLRDDSVEKLYRICLFHYLVEYIHPFYDGNGRLGRLILSYCISQTLEPLIAYRISETIKENINDYYKAFEICNDPHNLGDLTPFLIMQLSMIEKSIQELKDSLSRRLIRWKRYEQLIPELPEGAKNQNVRRLYSFLIQAALFSEKGISTSELKEQYNVSYNTLKKWLDVVPASLLMSEKKGKYKYYQMNLQELDALILKKAQEN